VGFSSGATVVSSWADAKLAMSSLFDLVLLQLPSGPLGLWYYDGVSAIPFSELDLTKIPTIRRGVVDTVTSPTEVELVAGHTLVSTLTGRLFDTSAGVEFEDKTITIAGNTCTWTGGVAGMAPGDQIWAVEDMGVFSVGDEANLRDIIVSANTDLAVDGGFDVQGRGISFEPLTNESNDLYDWMAVALGDVSAPSATADSYIGAGLYSRASGNCFLSTSYNDAGTWKRRVLHSNPQGPTAIASSAATGLPAANDEWSVYQGWNSANGAYASTGRELALTGGGGANFNFAQTLVGANGPPSGLFLTCWDAAGSPAMRCKFTRVNLVPIRKRT
jgi:hypothetical protein